MTAKISAKDKSTKPQNKLARLQRLSLFFFSHPRRTALIWLVIMLFGATCYTTWLKREGFPAVNTPFATASGSYLVNDPAKVDNDVAKPLNDFLEKESGVKSVQSQSYANLYNTVVSYDDGVNANTKSQALAKEIEAKHILPAQATLQLKPYEFGFTQRGDDLVVSYYNNDNSASTEQLVAKGSQAAAFIKSKHLSLVKDVSVISPFDKVFDPASGQTILNQKTFDQYGQRFGNSSSFYTSVVIGVKAQKGADNIKLDDQVQAAVNELNAKSDFSGYTGTISASYAPQIKQQIGELQQSLLEGLLAVLIIGSIIIAVRASIITVLSMLTVLATVCAVLYLIGYSLNTITLFALILSLTLIVDDTIIMVEAIEAETRREKDPRLVVTNATKKVTKAMTAATTTAALSFAPLIFVGGVLGGFIRSIPITIILALAISLFVALIFIPLFARYLLLSKKHMNRVRKHDFSAGIEAAVARFVSRPMLWAKGSTKKLFGVGIIALIIGFGFIGAGGFIFQKVTFNIFPPTKDTNQLSTTITYPPNTSLQQAQQTAFTVDKMLAKTVGNNFTKASYFGQADVQTATLTSDLIDYKDRDITAPAITKQLNNQFKTFDQAEVKTQPVDVGPPSGIFTVQVNSGQNRAAASKLADDMAFYMKHQAVLKRTDGKIAKIDTVQVSNSSIFNRTGNEQFIGVNVTFVDNDTTTLVTLAKKAVQDHFPPSKVASYGLPSNAVNFDTGQEQENQNSFKTLALAFPVLLLVMYFVLTLEFRSLLQPLLIFMAIPFSLFGITLGLYLTNNAFSFFAMLGFFALIGLSIKNTILLTDYANQARHAGMHPVDAAHEALAERFRPLIATSLTAVVALTPLALASPFWQGLSVVLIFGLISSTFLVITVFPYYYLGSEFLRINISRRSAIAWLLLTAALIVLLVKVAGPAAILAPFLAAGLVKYRPRRAKS